MQEHSLLASPAKPQPHRRPFFGGTVIMLCLILLVFGYVLLRNSYVYHNSLFSGRDHHLAQQAEQTISTYIDEVRLTQSQEADHPFFTSFKLYGIRELPASTVSRNYEAYIWSVTSTFAKEENPKEEESNMDAVIPAPRDDTHLVQTECISVPAVVKLQTGLDGSLQVTEIEWSKDANYKAETETYPWSVRYAFDKDQEANTLEQELEQANLVKASDHYPGVDV